MFGGFDRAVSGRRLFAALTGAICSVLPGRASAGAPEPWQMWLMEPVTPQAEQIADLHLLLLYIIVAITVFVVGLLGYVMWRFSAKRNPVPARFHHNTTLEVIWTGVPVLILVIIAIPSFRTLFFLDKVEDADMTLKIIGHQWYWSYEYPDQNVAMESWLKYDSDLTEEDVRLMSVDKRVVLPIDTDIRLLFTSADVLHSWAMPSFGIKMDTVPGRTNETWVRINKEGVYRGMCSELCGIQHGFMPIVVEAVAPDAFAQWVAQQVDEGYTIAAKYGLPEPGTHGGGDALPVEMAQTTAGSLPETVPELATVREAVQ